MATIARGSMKIGKIYVQNQTGQDLYFRPTGQTNTGVKGILYTVYHGRKTKGKNPKKYSVPNVYMDLWSDAIKVPSNIENKLKESKMATITRSRINEIIKEEYEKLVDSTGTEYDPWKNTKTQAKNIFRMLKQKHKNNIPDMKKGLELILKQNKTKSDQEKIMWQEFNKYFKIK